MAEGKPLTCRATAQIAATDKPDELQVLKVMRMGDSGQGGTLQRFMQEFALLAQVKHPNIAKIHRQDFAGAQAFLDDLALLEP